MEEVNVSGSRVVAATASLTDTGAVASTPALCHHYEVSTTCCNRLFSPSNCQKPSIIVHDGLDQTWTTDLWACHRYQCSRGLCTRPHIALVSIHLRSAVSWTALTAANHAGTLLMAKTELIWPAKSHVCPTHGGDPPVLGRARQQLLRPPGPVRKQTVM